MLYKLKVYILTIKDYIRNYFVNIIPIGTWPQIYRKPNSNEESIEYKIRGWQSRQKKVTPKFPDKYKNFSLWDLTKVHTKTIVDIKYVHDDVLYSKPEYWATTDEILKHMQGDCEDQAHLIMLRLAEIGIDPDKLGCLFVETNNGGHVFAIVQYCTNDFYILDNGCTGFAITTARKLLSRRKDIKVWVAYNFNDIWYYN